MAATESDYQHHIANSPTTIMRDHHIQNQELQQKMQPLRDNSVENTDLLSMLHLNSSATAPAVCHCHHPPCTSAAASGYFNSNSMKRRSPSSSSGAGEPSAKKLFCEQEDLALHGFSAVSLPLTLGALSGEDDNPSAGPVLRRCVSDPSKSTAAGSPAKSPECVNSGNPVPPIPLTVSALSAAEYKNDDNPAVGPVLRRCVSDPSKSPATVCPASSPERGNGCYGGNPVTPVKVCGLPPLPPRFRSPSPAKALSHSLSSEETPDSLRLRKIKDRMREMRQWWDEVMQDEEEQEEDECLVAEDDKESLPPQDELKGDSEEAVRVEWAEKCVSITFRCPCGKGYEVLLSANNCYYKLV